MKLREIVLKATRKVGKQLDKVFPPNKFVVNTPEMEELLEDAKAAKRVIDNVDRVLPYLGKERKWPSQFPEQERREIVENYRAAKSQAGLLIKTRGEEANMELTLEPYCDTKMNS